MRWHHTTLSLLIVACLATASHAEEATADSAEQFVKRWVATFNMNTPEKLLAFYNRSKETEIIISSGIRLQGFKAVQESGDERGSGYIIGRLEVNRANELTSDQTDADFAHGRVPCGSLLRSAASR